MAVLALLGAAYAQQCLDVLASPGTGILLYGKARGGQITLRAQSYTFDLTSMSLMANGATLEGPQKNTLAKVNTVSIRLPNLLNGKRKTLGVKLRGLEATLERDAQGRFVFLDALPLETEERSETPYAVEIEEARVEFVDRTIAGPTRLFVRIPWAKIDGVGPDWRAEGKLVDSKGGGLRASLRSEDQVGLGGNAELQGLDLAPWLGPIRRTPQLRDVEGLRELAASRLEARGTFHFWSPTSGPLDLYGKVVADGAGVTYGKWGAAAASLRANFDEAGAMGSLEARRSGLRAQFDGRIRWNPELELRGYLVAQAARKSEIPPELTKELPAELSFADAKFTGMLGFGKEQKFHALGTLSAARTVWNDLAAERLLGQVRFDTDGVSLRSGSVRFRGVTLQGGGDLSFAGQKLEAFAESAPFAIESFRSEIGLERLSGSARLAVRAVGTLKEPSVEIRAHGRASYDFEPGRTTLLGPFNAMAIYSDSKVQINRLLVAGPAGIATVSGTIRWPDKRLDLEAVATGIDLAHFLPEIQGTATGNFKVSGTAEEFRAVGPVEVYGLVAREQSIPLAGGIAEISGRRVDIKGLMASKGSARLTGEAGLEFESGALNGQFAVDGLQLHDFLEEGYEGSFRIEGGRLSGTLESPFIEAEVSGRSVVLQDIRLDSAEGSLQLRGTRLEATQSKFRAGAGTVVARGFYDWEARQGEAAAQASDLPLDRLQALLPSQSVLKGKASAEIRLEIGEDRLTFAEFDGGLEDLTVNGAFLGNGFFNGKAEGTKVAGLLEIGQPERFLQIGEFEFDSESRQIAAEISAFGLPVRDLYAASKPFLKTDTASAAESSNAQLEALATADRLEGQIDLNGSISGDISNPDLILESFIFREARLDQEPIGRIEASGLRKDEKWQVKELKWSGGPGSLDLRGSIDENGPIALDGNAYNFDTQWLSRFLPGLAKVSGDATMFFSVTGATRSPQIEASLNGSLFEANLSSDERDKDKELKLEIYPILIANGSISVNGLFNYRGFRGTVEGTVPFEYPFRFPEDKEAKIDFRVTSRPLDEFEELIPGLNPARTEGLVSADLTVSGHPGALEINGKIQLDAKSFAFEALDTELANLSATAQWKGTKLEVKGRAESSRGGELSASANLEFGSFDELFTSEIGSWLTHRLEGNVQLKNFRVAERNLALDAKKESLLNMEFSAAGGLRLTGTVQKPVISTYVPLAIERLKGEIPTVFVESAPAGPAAIAPEFRIAYVVGTRAQPAELRAATSVLNLYGGGTLKGALDDLEANASLRLHSGFLRLPNARINLQEGGTVKLRYDNSAFDSSLRLDVDIEGRTNLSTIKYGNLVERYDILLELRGNLLNPQEQVILARSDPPDLSQERILNLLGQIDLLEQLSGPITGSQERRQLQQALNTLAIPVLFDPVTNALAKELGLEYLSIDYGPLGQTNVTAAKWLGRGFILQGRREISEPIDGLTDYDLRLAYRPPRRIRTLRGLVFSLGIDQERPWKIAVEYGQRFRNLGPTNPTNLIRIGPP